MDIDSTNTPNTSKHEASSSSSSSHTASRDQHHQNRPLHKGPVVLITFDKPGTPPFPFNRARSTRLFLQKHCNSILIQETSISSRNILFLRLGSKAAQTLLLQKLPQLLLDNGTPGTAKVGRTRDESRRKLVMIGISRNYNSEDIAEVLESLAEAEDSETPMKLEIDEIKLITVRNRFYGKAIITVKDPTTRQHLLKLGTAYDIHTREQVFFEDLYTTHPKNRQCTKCWQIGHPTHSCTSSNSLCPSCGSSSHSGDCDPHSSPTPPSCIHCKSASHSSNSYTLCPILLKLKQTRAEHIKTLRQKHSPNPPRPQKPRQQHIISRQTPSTQQTLQSQSSQKLKHTKKPNRSNRPRTDQNRPVPSEPNNAPLVATEHPNQTQSLHSNSLDYAHPSEFDNKDGDEAADDWNNCTPQQQTTHLLHIITQQNNQISKLTSQIQNLSSMVSKLMERSTHPFNSTISSPTPLSTTNIPLPNSTEPPTQTPTSKQPSTQKPSKSSARSRKSKSSTTTPPPVNNIDSSTDITAARPQTRSQTRLTTELTTAIDLSPPPSGPVTRSQTRKRQKSPAPTKPQPLKTTASKIQKTTTIPAENLRDLIRPLLEMGTTTPSTHYTATKAPWEWTEEDLNELESSDDYSDHEYIG